MPQDTDSSSTPVATSVSKVPVEASSLQAIDRSDKELKESGMMKAGLTDELLFSVASAGLRAVKPQYDRDGDWVRDAEDWTTRFKFWEGLMRIKGYIRPASSEDNSTHLHLTLQQRTEIKERLMKVWGKVDGR